MLLGLRPKFFNVLRNRKAYEYIKIKNIQLVRGLLEEKPKNKTMKTYVQSDQYHINLDKEGSMRFPNKWY